MIPIAIALNHGGITFGQAAMAALLGAPGVGGVAGAALAALLLGLRHATDPDHLTAVSTLILSERPDGPRRAGLLGLTWGLGHAATLLGCGLPLVLFGWRLPEAAQSIAEAAVGALVVLLAVRLLVRWRRGYFHVHPHRHGEVVHAHPHVHEHPPSAEHPPAHRHEHRHARSLGRSPAESFGIGLVHGVGGSAGAGLLVVSTLPPGAQRAAGLLAFALGTAVAMLAASAILGHAVARRPLLRRLEQAVPWVGAASLLFGVWYGLAALGVP